MGIVEELESAIDMVDLVGRYTKLKKSGANYKALCPFPGHSEKTPSFMVSPTKQIAYCFGCHKGGGAVKFIMDIENCSFREAIEILSSLTGIKVNGNFGNDNFKEKKNLYSLYKDATNYYKNALKNYPEVKKYLYDRGLNEEIINNFNIGYSDSGIELFSYLKSKGYEDEQISESQIFLDIKSKKDKFIGRVIFPIQNSRGDFVAFAGRILDKGEPKYLNSPASKIYDKSNILYNIFNARQAITKEDFVIICEGYMDVIALNRGGILNCVAVSGTALTEKHLTLVKRLTKKVFLCFDGDSAGQKATKLSLEKMKNEGFEVRIISLPNGKDPDEIISSGKDFKEFIKNALTPIGYFIKKSKFNTESLEDKKILLTEALELIKSYSDGIEKDFYLKELSKLLEIKESIVYDRFNKIKFSYKKSDEDANLKAKNNISSKEMIIAYCLIDESNLEFFKQKIIFEEYLPKDLKEIFENGIEKINNFPLEKKEKIRGISLKIEDSENYKNSLNKAEDLEKIMNGLNREIFKQTEEALKQKINSGDNDALLEYTKLINKAKKSGIK
ncbi:DNA primase [Candidatus Gracilibacteria bacterium]|nr:MAG: DNA primase [Candidatus Gracilibacteria bacterium]